MSSGASVLRRQEQRNHWAFQDTMLKWILGLLTAAIIAVCSWIFQINNAVTTMSEQVRTAIIARAELDKNDSSHDQRFVVLETRTRALEVAASSQQAQYNEIQRSLDRIDGRLNQVLEAPRLHQGRNREEREQ